jgi:hypothetical protein
MGNPTVSAALSLAVVGLFSGALRAAVKAA